MPKHSNTLDGSTPRVNTNTHEFLSDTSPKDKPWDEHKTDTVKTAWVFKLPQAGGEFDRKAERMQKCSESLEFAFAPDENGEVKYSLENARFCRVRNCPTCQWRRSLLWKAKFYKALPSIVAAAPSGRWIFATFTIKNCPIGKLSDTLKIMNDSWNRLRLRKEFENVIGWVRTTEVTRNPITNEAHPHFHVLFLVRSSYFKGPNYISKDKWEAAWSGSLRVNYVAHVDVKAVKDKKTGKVVQTSDPAALAGAVAETLKYAIKPADMFSNHDFFYELCRQINRKRFVASGGVLKNLFKDEKKEEELLLKDDESTDVKEKEKKATVKFNYEGSVKRYARRRN